MTAMRQLVGEVLRARRISQGLTLREFEILGGTGDLMIVGIQQRIKF